MNDYSFGSYIRELREKKGFSQSELGAKLGVTNKAVSRWENGGAYPSAELMLPLAQALGITIEELYMALTEDKQPKTKLRGFLEYFLRHTKMITLVCLALSLIPYILFLCFYHAEDKMESALFIPVSCVLVYGLTYLAFVLFRKNPFASAKMMDVYTVFVLGFITFSYISTTGSFIFDFPNGIGVAWSWMPLIFVAVTHSLKRRYR